MHVLCYNILSKQLIVMYTNRPEIKSGQIVYLYRRPIPCYSDPTSLSAGSKLTRAASRKKKKALKKISVALPNLHNLKKLETRMVSTRRLERLWDVTNEPDSDAEEEEEFDWSLYADFKDPSYRKQPPGGSSGSFVSSR